MKQFVQSGFAILACGVVALGVSAPTPASADTYSTFDVDANYDSGAGTLTGYFTLDTTTNTSYAVDLTLVGVGGVNSATLTDPTAFQTGTYATAAGTMPTYDDENPANGVFLTYPAGGGALYTGGFGEASVDSYFSPECGTEICSFPLSGTVTLAAAPGTTPLPGSVVLFGSVLAVFAAGGWMRQRRKTAFFSPLAA